MNNDEALALVGRVFDGLLRADNIAGLEALVSNDKVLRRRCLDRAKYPELSLRLLPSDVQTLQGNYLTQDLHLRADVSGRLATPLEKLLYALAWKNGDQAKVHHILKGVLDTLDGYTLIKGESQVFRQFGRHLADPSEPIVDKHVLRAFALYESPPDAVDATISNLRRKKSWNEQPECISRYKLWLSTHFTERQQVEAQFFMHVDAVLFALGKAIKLGK